MTETERPPRGRNASADAIRDSTIAVRVAVPADLEVIVAMRMALLRGHGDHSVYGRLRPDAEARARRLFARQIEARDEVIFLAQRGDQVVGCLRCVRSLNSPLLLPDEYGYVSSVYVRPHARRGGVLRALLAAAEQWCEARGIGELRLHNAAGDSVAAATWDALGFSVVEQLRQKSLPDRATR